MKRILAQVRKELTQLRRDRLTLALALVLPILLLLLLSKATSLTVKDIPLVVQDLDKTPTSRSYIEAVSASLSFKVSALPPNLSPERVLDQDEARAALIIPPNFERDLLRTHTADVQWLVDGTDANTANVMRGKAAAISQSFSAGLQPAPMQPAIKPQIRYWFNPGRSDLEYFGPGVLAFGLAMFPPLLAALAHVARRRVENDPASLCFQHHRVRIPRRKGDCVHDCRLVRMDLRNDRLVCDF